MVAYKWLNEDGTRKSCSADECSEETYAHGLCSKHYQREWKLGSLPDPVRWTDNSGVRMKCLHLNCDDPIKTRGLCSKHYQRSQAGKKPSKGFRETKWVNPDGTRKTCSRESCESPVKVSGLCSPHYHAHNKIGTDREKKGMRECPVPGCGRQMAYRKIMCAKCNQTCWRYGLTLERWVEMNQNRQCSNKACTSPENLHIDHDHSCTCHGTFNARDRVSCGVCVRGWLCRSCNLGLGYFKDDPELLRGIADYVLGAKNPLP